MANVDFRRDLRSGYVLIAGLFGSSFIADRILQETRQAALTKAAKGLPSLAPFAKTLTHKR
jgi:hypothetical protein